MCVNYKAALRGVMCTSAIPFGDKRRDYLLVGIERGRKIAASSHFVNQCPPRRRGRGHAPRGTCGPGPSGRPPVLVYTCVTVDTGPGDLCNVRRIMLTLLVVVLLGIVQLDHIHTLCIKYPSAILIPRL
uniref:SFRICE_023648 n=1 Tax=Spodoptera frugiperda TaxID=7108 RepID=A0A2H1VE88_SPOFR